MFTRGSDDLEHVSFVVNVDAEVHHICGNTETELQDIAADSACFTQGFVRYQVIQTDPT